MLRIVVKGGSMMLVNEVVCRIMCVIVIGIFLIIDSVLVVI